MSPLCNRNLTFDEKWANITPSKCIANLPGITMGGLNVRSIVRKLDDVMILLGNSEMDFLGISETWLNQSISNAELSIQGYNMFRGDRDGGLSTRGGGGVLAFVKAARDFEFMTKWTLCCEDIEWIWFKMNSRATRPTYIGVFYCPPPGNVEHFLNIFENKVVDILSNGPVDIVVVGDINIDMKASRLTNSRKYKSTCHTLGLSQLITSPTHVTMDSATIIDHILTNREDLYPRSSQIDCGISDHHLILTAQKKRKIPRQHLHHL